MNKELMQELYNRIGDDLSRLYNFGEEGMSFISYKKNYKSDTDVYHQIPYCCIDDFILTHPAGIGKHGWNVVCTIGEYYDFCMNSAKVIPNDLALKSVIGILTELASQAECDMTITAYGMTLFDECHEEITGDLDKVLEILRKKAELNKLIKETVE